MTARRRTRLRARRARRDGVREVVDRSCRRRLTVVRPPRRQGSGGAADDLVVSRHRSSARCSSTFTAATRRSSAARSTTPAGRPRRARPGRRGARRRAPAARLGGRALRRRRAPRRCRRARRSTLVRARRPAPALHRRLAAHARRRRCRPSCAGCPRASRRSRTSRQLPASARPRARAGADAPPRRRGAQAAGRPAGDRRPLAAGLEPVALCERVLETLGESLGWTAGAVWRPDGARLTLRRPRGTRPRRRAAVAALANADAASRTSPPARASRASVWAFRRPVWLGADRRGAPRRPGHRRRVPDRVGDECVGVIELYATDVREPNAEVSAMFATVGGQLAAYLARRRKRARARRSFDGAARAGRRARRRRPRRDRQRHRVRRARLRRGRAARPRLVRHHRLRPRGLGPLPGGRDHRPAVDARHPLALVTLPRRRRHAARRGRLGRARAVWAESPPARYLEDMRRLALALAAVALLGTACGSDEPTPASAETDLAELAVTVDATATRHAAPRSCTLTCKAPTDSEACGAAAGVSAADLAPTPDDMACTQIYGGPERRRSRARSAATPSTRPSRARTAARSSAGPASSRCSPRPQ